jgi:AMP nucleosidase
MKISSGAAAAEALTRLYTASVDSLKSAIQNYARGKAAVPGPASARDFVYPEIAITYHGSQQTPRTRRSFARLSRPGRYVTTVTRPDIFGDYLA